MSVARRRRTETLLVSVAEAARIIGTGTGTVHDLIAAGHLRARALPGQRHPRVVRASIQEWIDQDRPAAPERVMVSHPMVVPPLGGWRRAG